MSHEERIINLFGRKEKRERLLFLASKPKRRAELVLALLHDTRNLETSRMLRLGVNEMEATYIASRLRATVSSRAHCISAISEIDGRELSLGAALGACVGREQDTIVFCPDTGLAYYENHEGECFILGRA